MRSTILEEPRFTFIILRTAVDTEMSMLTTGSGFLRKNSRSLGINWDERHAILELSKREIDDRSRQVTQEKGFFLHLEWSIL